MGIEVQLRAENGSILEQVSDPKMVLSRATSMAFATTRLLKYVVPWGDAMFNQAQATDLAHDLREVALLHEKTPLAAILKKVEPLVEKLALGGNVYLWFVGD